MKKILFLVITILSLNTPIHTNFKIFTPTKIILTAIAATTYTIKNHCPSEQQQEIVLSHIQQTIETLYNSNFLQGAVETHIRWRKQIYNR